MGRSAGYRAILAALPPERWDAYLAEESGLPGPRANLELAQAVAEAADGARIRSYGASGDEFLALCGAIGWGRLLAEGGPGAEETLHALALDRRWRVREGVAMALQRVGDADMSALWAVVDGWADDAPLVQRAAAAAVCEPRLLRAAPDARRALALLDRITRTLAGRDPGSRHADDVRVLRQALGYCWSVAVAALPAEGFELLAHRAASGDPDVRWILRENLRKARLTKAGGDRAAELAARLNRPG